MGILTTFLCHKFCGFFGLLEIQQTEYNQDYKYRQLEYIEDIFRFVLVVDHILSGHLEILAKLHRYLQWEYFKPLRIL